MFKRQMLNTILKRLSESRLFIQVLAGPRQVGKTTLAQQAITELAMPSHYASADDSNIGSVWLEQQWDIGRIRARQDGGALLVLDEIQKVPRWSDIVKRLWEEDSRSGTDLKILLLGSSQLLLAQGLTESLAGRFEIVPVRHWSFAEMSEAFGFSLEQYLFFGGYPGSAALIDDRQRWGRYIIDSLVESTISRDILMMTRVDKPALLRRLFRLGCDYSGQMLSYQKMVGQLQDVGNTTTLAHYLDLLEGAGMVAGLQKFAGQSVRSRASSPKLQVLNTALLSAQSPYDLVAAMEQRDWWGRLVESAVGAHIMNGIVGTDIECFYWREGSLEVDFVLRRGGMVVAIEVKSNRSKETLPGMDAFALAFKPQRKLLVGGQGISIGEFLATPVDVWLAEK
jgi:predicted AAA+ superfamily ATPase